MWYRWRSCKQRVETGAVGTGRWLMSLNFDSRGQNLLDRTLVADKTQG